VALGASKTPDIASTISITHTVRQIEMRASLALAVFVRFFRKIRSIVKKKRMIRSMRLQIRVARKGSLGRPEFG